MDTGHSLFMYHALTYGSWGKHFLPDNNPQNERPLRTGTCLAIIFHGFNNVCVCVCVCQGAFSSNKRFLQKIFWVQERKRKTSQQSSSPSSLGSVQFKEVHLSAVLNLRTSERVDRLLCFTKTKCWVGMQHWVFPKQLQVHDIKTFGKTSGLITFPWRNNLYYNRLAARPSLLSFL